jgi:uncharacterized protein (TIGR04255 family)
MTRPTDLPDYERPPIDEVAVGVGLVSPIGGFVDPHAGLFWQRVKGRYPNAESHPRVETLPAAFADSVASSQPVPFPFSASAGSRTFLISGDDSYLLQVQNNRFFRNWRRREAEYPHFDALSTDFLSELKEFRSFLTDEGLKESPISSLEVTYINWIPDLRMEELLLPAAAAKLETDSMAAWPRNQSWQAVYECRDDDSENVVANLIAACAPAARTTLTGVEHGVQFAFTYSHPGRPAVGTDEIPELLTKARRYIVRSFTQLTTDEAHKHWLRIQ